MLRADVASLHAFQLTGFFPTGDTRTSDGAFRALAWLLFFARHGVQGVTCFRPPCDN